MKILTRVFFVSSACLLMAGSFESLSPISDANAIVGRPATPVSYAGVARRSVYAAPVHVVAAPVAYAATAAVVTTAVVATSVASATAASQQAAAQAAAMNGPPIGSVFDYLPANCGTEAVNGVEYSNCGGVYYRATFQGNSLVYVVQNPWS